PHPQEYTIDEALGYDRRLLPGDEDEDEDEDDVKDVGGSTLRQRAIFREFYSKLGQLSQLRVLNMNRSRYSVRVKDELKLVLPGLQQNLARWELDLADGYYIGEPELKFFGTHFGYGYDFTNSEDNDRDRLEGKTRVAELEVLVWNGRALGKYVCYEVLGWAEGQGFRLKIAQEYGPMSSTLPTSPFDVPEIASLIASYISKDSDLARCARVSRSLYDICIPILWKSIHFNHLFFRRDPDFDKEDYQVDLIRSGKLSFIKELTITYDVTDDDVEMIAEHCTGLKALNFDGVKLTAENLAKLIPSNRHQTEDIDVDDRSKRRKTRLTINLESLSFKECFGVAGAACLDIVSSLGPQLKQLLFEDFDDITDQDMIKVVQRCPNLVSLQLEKTSITDEFLKYIAQIFQASDSSSTPGLHKRHLENLNLDLNRQVSGKGILPVVMTCRSSLKSLSAQVVGSVGDEVLFALVGDHDGKTAAEGSKVGPHFTSQPNVLQQTSDKKSSIAHYRFSPNTVLTEIRLSQSVGLTDVGLEILFRFATELGSIDLDGSDIGDGALMVLAEMYRNRMNALGLGVPAAWREHILADERVQAMSRAGATVESLLAAGTTVPSSDIGVKVFTGGHVPDPHPEEDDPEEDDSVEAEYYDHMAMYGDEGDGDDDGDVKDVRHYTPRQRAILREFYSKLGQLSQLRVLIMNQGRYGVRVKDGLNLVLPGLQQNLMRWELDLEDGYFMGNLEMEFFGKHFGYGHTCTDWEEGDEDLLEGEPRVAALEVLVWNARALECVFDEILEWTMHQGFRLERGMKIRFQPRLPFAQHHTSKNTSSSMPNPEIHARQSVQNNSGPMSSTLPTSPFDIPEIASLIACYIADNSDLARCARVSHSLHDICIPILWRSISLSSDAAMKVWHRDGGFRTGLIRYSKFCPIEQLHLTHTRVQDGDMELIAENCTRLKTLDLTATNVTTETLRVLIHSDPHRTRNSGAGEGGKKRKIKSGPLTKRSRRSGQYADDDDHDDDDEVEYEDEDEVESGKDELDQDSSVRRTMPFTELTETETEREPDSQYESVGIEHSTATESEQDSNQPTGPILIKSKASALLELPIPLHRSAGTARPVKFKGVKTPFPFSLESLILKRCPNLAGPSCLEVVSLLGPQLKRLVLNHVSDITDQDMIKFVKHCPNLVELQLRGTEITDGFLVSFAQEFLPSDSLSTPRSRHRQCLENLNLDMTSASSTGLLPMIKACKSHLNTLSMHHLHGVADDVLFALFEDPGNQHATTVSMTAPTSLTTQALAFGSVSDHVLPMTTYQFSPNTVLTDIHLAFCSLITDAGFEILFRFATELVSVDLSGCELKDETLMVLAETYRNRMKTLGLGMPAAWRDHLIAEENKAHVLDQHVTTTGMEGHHHPPDVDATVPHHTTTRITTTPTLDNKSSSSDVDSKVFTDGRVPGGLRKLLLPHCKHLTNKGARAILRSCVGLEILDIGNCSGFTLELFQGPWACVGITDLHMENMALQVSLVDLGFAQYEDTTVLKKQILEENKEWFWRHPSQLNEYPQEEDFDEDGHYDHVVIPIVRRHTASSDESSDDEIDNDDDDHDNGAMDEDEDDDNDVVDNDEKANKARRSSFAAGSDGMSEDDEDEWEGYDRRRKARRKEAQRRPVPSELRRNNPRQRSILRAFYSKLGQLSQLRILNMTNCNFRIRVKDGLGLILPALQRNLIEWRLNLVPSYRLQNMELEFFGKHFGYGCDFTPEENKNDEEEKEKEEGEEKKQQTRTGKLRVLVLEATSLDHVNPKVLHWALHQGFHLNFEDGHEW
ncbi:hypothetical protein EC968_004142, partial [Mortierella alpina]